MHNNHLIFKTFLSIVKNFEMPILRQHNSLVIAWISPKNYLLKNLFHQNTRQMVSKLEEDTKYVLCNMNFAIAYLKLAQGTRVQKELS